MFLQMLNIHSLTVWFSEISPLDSYVDEQVFDMYNVMVRTEFIGFRIGNSGGFLRAR